LTDRLSLINTLFAWLITHQPTVLFSHNKSANTNQPTVLFSRKKPANRTFLSEKNLHQPSATSQTNRLQHLSFVLMS
jgi:hypothetical protein